ncbi:MAG TPA: 3'-5' exonuclease [Candidatus Paceibacterota bacterium]|nr:3'-5' exonuclease [Candidatus Paceibacterota bacterium]
MRNQNFAFIDLEATGTNVIQHEIIEIGCVITDSDLNVIEEFEMKVKPERIEGADPVALKVNQYDESAWKDAYSLEEAMEIFSKKVKGCVMVGQNVAFDSAFLEHALATVGLPNEMHYHKLDTLSIAWAKLHRNTEVLRFSLRELCVKFGIVNEKAHTALSDARATYLLYKKLMEL